MERIVVGAVPNEVVWRHRGGDGFEHMTWLPVREEIVRCRDCKHSVTTIWRECGSEWTDYECNLLRDFGGTPLMIDLDAYCAWGERRDA